MAVQKDVNYSISFGDSRIVNGMSVHSNEFDDFFYYDGDDLGCDYSPNRSSFRLWAPTASVASLLIYDAWDSAAVVEMPMKRSEKGTWTVTVYRDLVNYYYNYKVQIGEQWHEAVDPYARAVGVNGDRGAIVNLDSTTPQNWDATRSSFSAPVDAVIYEVHVRDLTVHSHSGAEHKGKFLGAAELGTRGPNLVRTGLEHIKDLGVTHIQFLPIYDYSTDSVDETNPDASYNWGYDPKNYNVPEGSYSTDPYSPTVRITELKTLIQTIHNEGMHVIMDVVYNHVYDAYRHSFMKLVPGYYYRYRSDLTLSNGSGCGNDVASERKMVRKYIVESVVFWAREYNLDGFRFDLMGLHDIDTMNEIRARLNEIDPSIIIIGEGWDIPTELNGDRKATQHNAWKMPRIAHFNDGLRDTLKGNTFNLREPGFASGRGGLEHDVKRGIIAGIQYHDHLRSFALEPDQCVNYVEAHDNHTLWDKLSLTSAHLDEMTRRKIHMLCSAIVLTSQGIPFIHAGQEFMRTKNGDENSYKSSTLVNQMDWQRCAQFSYEVNYIRRLIQLRKNHAAFRMPKADQIRNHLIFENAPANSVAYTLRNHANQDVAKDLYVLHNANWHPIEVQLPTFGLWRIAFGEEFINQSDLILHGAIKVQPYATIVLVNPAD
jgi:pullulanase